MAKDYFEKYIKNIANDKSEKDSDWKNGDIVQKNLTQYNNEIGQNEIVKYLETSIERIIRPLVEGINIKVNASLNNSVSLYDLSINGGNVIIPGIGICNINIGIKDGKIAALTDNNIPAKEEIDASGKYVSPGIIDPHVHLGLFAPFEKEIETETRAAIAGGVTTLGCFFGGQDSHFKTFPQLEEYIDKLSYTDIIPHLVINNDVQKREIRDYINYLGITSFKLYMNGIPGIVPDVDDGFILDVFEEIRKTGKECIVCVHAENRYIVRRAMNIVKNELQNNAKITDWSKTHPELAEEEAIIRLSYLAEKTGIKVYIVHVSSSDAVRRLRSIKCKNRFVNVETTSPYLSINSKSIDSNIIKMEPPFRNPEDVEELWSGIQDDTIDTIGTDNVTMTKAEKRMQEENLWDVMPGYPAVETHLPVLLTEGVVKRKIPIEKIIEKVTKKPAELFGVYPRKGSMMVGSDADITIIDMNLVKQVNVKNLYSRSDFSLYEGRKLQGWPITTIKSGKVVFKDGQFTNEKANCIYLKRK